MKTITFYSYKGGVGRTLALSNIANRLAEFGKKVFIIDFDLEAPGVPFKFKNFDSKKIKKGLVDYISDFISGHQIPTSIRGFTCKLNVGHNKITLLPAGNNYTREYWSKLSAINWNDLFYKPNGRGIEFFLDLKNKIRKEFNPDFLLIDSRTGITEISGITISIFANEVVLFLANNKESIEGTAQVIRSILSSENQLINESPKVNLALSRIPYRIGKEEIYQDEFIKRTAYQKINALIQGDKFKLSEILLIHSDRELEIQEKFKIGFTSLISSEISTNEQVSISKDYLSLFERVTKDVLTQEEIARFNTIKTAEIYFNQSNITDDTGKKIEFLKAAIKLNDTYEDAYTSLIASFINLNNIQEANNYLEKLLKFNPNNYAGILLKGFIFFKNQEYDLALSKFAEIFDFARATKWIEPFLYSASIYAKKGSLDKALELGNELIAMAPESSMVYNLMANNYRLIGNYDEALKYIYKAIELDPKNPIAYGTFAEINAHLGNHHQFYLNLELALIFKIDLERVLNEESIYSKYYSEERFLNLLKKYNISFSKDVPD